MNSFEDDLSSWEEAEFGRAVEEPAEQFEEQASTPHADHRRGGVDAYFSEAERRLDVAQYYKLLLGDNIFDGDGPAAHQVEEEVRAFALQRLETLLGIRSESQLAQAVVASLPFDDEEVAALKAVAKKILRRGEEVLAPRPTPSVKPALKPVQQVPVKPASPPPAPKAPAVRKRPSVAKPVPAPEPQRAQPAPAPMPARPRATPPATSRSLAKTAETAEVGEVFVERGKRYIWVVDDDGKKYKKDVTGQVGNPMAIPLPTGAAMEAISAQQAGQSIEGTIARVDRVMSRVSGH